ncbi:Adenomatous polyposis coli protein 2 [Varanus komodoensis]|nr:Adenomatous polyposis coli protein 2 [Varanus komodoensis]
MPATPLDHKAIKPSMEELKMSGSIASYDQLVRQVEALKKENTHLRRELEDNSNHLSKLENETSDMKVGCFLL